MIEIPGYTVLRLLGQGGMATVYLALQQSLSREVALKVLSPALALDAVATERFLREARVSAKLHHPNIVAIHDVGVHGGLPYMSIGYEPGGTVAQANHARSDSLVAMRIVRDIANALDYAHSQGVVHRDVKPENILLRKDGSCVLSDFGIAYAIEVKAGLTSEGTSVGTPHYMSPEQLRGEAVDGRSDLYSLGVVFYQLLTGDLPYQGTDGWAIGIQHITAPVPRLPAHLSQFQKFLDSMLAKEPLGRPQTAAEVVKWAEARLSGRMSAMTAALPSAPPTTRIRSEPASIAILPFEDMSQGRDQQYLADGLSEELLNLLSKVEGLHVASRSSAFSFKGKSAKLVDIGRELKVATILEGSVRKFGERVRISVQLVNVADGFQMWSETYDRQLTDVFAVQDEIAGLVVTALKAKLLSKPEPAASPSRLEAAEAELRTVRESQARDAAERAAAEARMREAAEKAAAEARLREAAEKSAEEARQREAAEKAAAEARLREVAEKAAAEARLREAAEKAADEARQREAAEKAAAEARLREAAEKAAAEARLREAAEKAAAEVRQREAADKAAAEARQREAEERAAVAESRQREATEKAAAERAAAEKRQSEAEARAAAAEARQREAEERVAAAEARQREAAEKALVAEASQREAAEKAAAAEARHVAAAEKAATEARQRVAAEQATAAALQRVAAERAEAESRERQRSEALAKQREATERQTTAARQSAGTAPGAILAGAPATRQPGHQAATRQASRVITPLRGGIAALVVLSLSSWLVFEKYAEKPRAPTAAVQDHKAGIEPAAPTTSEAATQAASAVADQPAPAEPASEQLQQPLATAEPKASVADSGPGSKTNADTNTAAAARDKPVPPVASPLAPAAGAATPAPVDKALADSSQPPSLDVLKAAAEATTPPQGAGGQAKPADAAIVAEPAPPPVPAAVTPASGPSTLAELVAVSNPQPPYPAKAKRGWVMGSVTASFTVNKDGSVSNVQVLSAYPYGVFDANVISTVSGWKFQPIPEPQTATRTFTFRP